MPAKRRRIAIAALLLILLCGLLWLNIRRKENLIVAAQGREAFRIAFVPDGSAIACGGVDGTVRFWDVNVDWWRSRRVLKTFTGHRRGITQLTFTRDGTLMATADANGEIRIWDVAQSALRRVFPARKDTIVALTLFPDDQTLAVTFDPPYSSPPKYGPSWLELWNISSGKRQRVITVIQARGISVSPDGRFYVVRHDLDSEKKCCEPKGELRRLSDGKLLRVMQGFGYDIGCCTTLFSPDEKTLAPITGVGFAQTWDVTSGKLLHTFSTHASPFFGVAAFSPDSGWLAIGGGGWGINPHTPVNLFSVKSPAVSRDIGPYLTTENAVVDVAFSPDSTWLATSRYGIGVQVWRIK